MRRFRSWIATFGALALGVAALPGGVGASATAGPTDGRRPRRCPGLPPVVNGVAPGPEILYRPPARAPQLENTGVWKADPTRVCMTSAYRSGEFLYQDCLWDDHGGGPAYRWYYYTYHQSTTGTRPTPGYRNNAADIVEVRLKPLDDATAVRITYNTMTDPDLVAATVALGGDAGRPVAVPHGANTEDAGPGVRDGPRRQRRHRRRRHRRRPGPSSRRSPPTSSAARSRSGSRTPPSIPAGDTARAGRRRRRPVGRRQDALPPAPARATPPPPSRAAPAATARPPSSTPPSATTSPTTPPGATTSSWPRWRRATSARSSPPSTSPSWRPAPTTTCSASGAASPPPAT